MGSNANFLLLIPLNCDGLRWDHALEIILFLGIFWKKHCPPVCQEYLTSLALWVPMLLAIVCWLTHHSPCLSLTVSSLLQITVLLTTPFPFLSFLLFHYGVHLQGLVSVVGEDRRVMLQSVKELYEAEPVDPWPTSSPRSCRFIIIG